MPEHLIVRSNIKKITGEFNVAGDFEDSLNNKIESMIKEAVERAKANNRRTVMGRDL